MATDEQLDASVRRVLLGILEDGGDYNAIPLLNPDTSLFSPAVVDALRAPLESAVIELDADVAQLQPAVSSLETLVEDGRLSEPNLAGTIGSAVEANDLGTLAAFPGYTSVGAHVGAPQFSLSNGTDTGCYTRIRHNILGDAQMVRLVYSNWWWRESAAVTDEAGPNAITVRAAIERPDGTKIPVFFNGSRDVVIQPGANAVSDPVAVDVKYDDASAFVYSRNYVTVTSGQKFPLNQYVVTASNAQDQMDIGTTTTDKTLTGTGASAAGQGFGPTIVLGNRPVASRRKPLVAIVGDSIPWGNDDTTTGADAGLKDRGFVNRALETAVIPYVKIAAGGDSPSYFNQFTKSQYRRGLITGSEYAIFYASINRIRLGDSFATVQADALAMWNWLAARGMKVYACTIGPKTTSSNGWTTTGAQTLDTYNANRVLFNDWIRTTPAPLTGYFEVADVMETARNSGIWKVDGAGSYTTDGLHPKTSMHKLMAAAIDTSVLV